MYGIQKIITYERPDIVLFMFVMKLSGPISHARFFEIFSEKFGNVQRKLMNDRFSLFITKLQP